ncbi:MAG: c-type cytochrome [Burkholderiales bacterium]|nr:c-type cytochrome [Burkholderiales bacterium]
MSICKCPRWLKITLVVLLVLGAVGGFTAWYKFFREVPQPAFANAEERFKYGSIGGENEAGLPYWLYLVLPRLFPEHLPGPGGYASLGLPWEPGHDTPIGFTKKTVGFPRVSQTCAVCHTTSYRVSHDSNPVFIPAGPGHTTDIQGFFRFLKKAVNDPRFNADNIMSEIAMVTKLSWLDRQIYRFLLIPITQQRLKEQNFDWMERPHMPGWGPGRDDPMNLTKYFMLNMPEDGTYGPADMPSIWNLDKYKPGMALNWDGATSVPRSVIIDSALGIMVKPQRDFKEQMHWMENYLRKLPAPKYPFALDTARAAVGKQVFDRHCASCHASERTGHSVPLAEISTDDERLNSWNKEAAIKANQVVRDKGVIRDGMVEQTLTGYVAQFLDGIWARAPYLHNGAVPTLRDLLTPPAQRPAVFWRGYDVYDPVQVGFITQGPQAERNGYRHDTNARANSNRGHDFGTRLPETEKSALIEYLKTL